MGMLLNRNCFRRFSTIGSGILSAPAGSAPRSEGNKLARWQVMAIDLSTTIKQANAQLSCSLGEEVAILNVNSALYYSFGDVGRVIWEQLKEEKSAKELCKVVTEQFDVTEGRSESDVIAFLNELADAGLIEIVCSTPRTNI